MQKIQRNYCKSKYKMQKGRPNYNRVFLLLCHLWKFKTDQARSGNHCNISGVFGFRSANVVLGTGD